MILLKADNSFHTVVIQNSGRNVDSIRDNIAVRITQGLYKVNWACKLRNIFQQFRYLASHVFANTV